MNIRAKRVFTSLPIAIDKFDSGIIYDYDQVGKRNPEFTMLRIDLTYLIDFYFHKAFLTNAEQKGLNELLNSEDRQNWLVAFVIINELRHKLWK